MYDVLVIGSGPGGYVAAIRCAQLGFKTGLVERYKTLGGTCLNVGCIPSKSLLDSSEHYHNAHKHFSSHGVVFSGLRPDLNKMMVRKNAVLRQICQGVSFLMKKNKIEVHHGHASFVDDKTLAIKPTKGKASTVQAKHFIIATGSKPASLPFISLDKERVITSTEALTLKEIPKHLVVIGGGVIGMELGSVYARLGSKVSVVEYLPQLIPSMDLTLGKELQKFSQTALGCDFYLRHKVSKVARKDKQVTVQAADSQGKELRLKADYVLVSVGRKPYTEGLHPEKAGVKTNELGQIEVNEQLQTSVPHIYAIGDVVQGAMLAHKAEEEGVLVAEQLAGQKPKIHYLLIPNVVYTWPEVAGVGHTEQALKEKNHSYKTGIFPFKALGRAKASGDEEGLVKVLADKETDEVLGVHIFGARAADMIAAGVVAMEYRASAEDIVRMSHAHPTYMEAFKEACLAATQNRALHI